VLDTVYDLFVGAARERRLWCGVGFRSFGPKRRGGDY
jgi:hypothetical protein